MGTFHGDISPKEMCPLTLKGVRPLLLWCLSASGLLGRMGDPAQEFTGVHPTGRLGAASSAAHAGRFRRWIMDGYLQTRTAGDLVQ